MDMHTLQWRRNLLYSLLCPSSSCRQTCLLLLWPSLSHNTLWHYNSGGQDRVWAWPGEWGEDAGSYKESIRKEHPMSVSVTYCGAHAVPKWVSYFFVELLLSCVVHVCSSILCCVMWQCTALLHHSHMHTEYLCYCTCIVSLFLHYYSFLQR